MTALWIGVLAQWVAVALLFLFVRHWGRFAQHHTVREERATLTIQLIKAVHDEQVELIERSERAAATLTQAVIDLQRLKESA